MMKQNKLFKKLWIFVLVLSFIAAQYTPVQAAAKTNNFNISPESVSLASN